MYKYYQSNISLGMGIASLINYLVLSDADISSGQRKSNRGYQRLRRERAPLPQHRLATRLRPPSASASRARAVGSPTSRLLLLCARRQRTRHPRRCPTRGSSSRSRQRRNRAAGSSANRAFLLIVSQMPLPWNHLTRSTNNYVCTQGEYLVHISVIALCHSVQLAFTANRSYLQRIFSVFRWLTWYSIHIVSRHNHIHYYLLKDCARDRFKHVPLWNSISWVYLSI